MTLTRTVLCCQVLCVAKRGLAENSDIVDWAVLKFDDYVVILKVDLVAGNGFGCRRSEYIAGGDIKNGAMPRTSNLGTVNFALAKRTADVSAIVVDGVKGSVNVEDGYFFAGDFD